MDGNIQYFKEINVSKDIDIIPRTFLFKNIKPIIFIITSLFAKPNDETLTCCSYLGFILRRQK